MPKKCLILIIFIWCSWYLTAQDSQKYLDKGWEAARIHDFELALQFTEMGIKYRDVWIFNHYYLKGFVFLEKQQYDDAKAAFEVACKIDEKNANYKWVLKNSFWGLGRVYNQTKEYKKEIQAYKKALEYGESANLYNNIGSTYLDLDNTEMGLKYLTKAIELDADNAYAFNNRAWTFIKLKHFELAKKDLDRSKILDESNPYLYRNYALYYIGLDDLDAACLNLKKAQKLRYQVFADEDEKMDVINLIKEYCLELGIKQ